MDLPYFTYPSICWWLFGLFLLWAIMNNATMKICVQIFVWIYVFISLGYISLGVKLLGHMAILCLTS